MALRKNVCWNVLAIAFNGTKIKHIYTYSRETQTSPTQVDIQIIQGVKTSSCPSAFKIYIFNRTLTHSSCRVSTTATAGTQFETRVLKYLCFSMGLEICLYIYIYTCLQYMFWNTWCILYNIWCIVCSTEAPINEKNATWNCCCPPCLVVQDEIPQKRMRKRIVIAIRLHR